MSEENFDEQVDLVSEGITSLREPDELDLAADREDREEVESQTETSDVKDDGEGEEERFAYTMEDGTEIEGTFAEIMEKVGKSKTDALQAQISELQSKLAEFEKNPARAATESAAMSGMEPVQWDKVGESLEVMLSGGDPERGIPGPEGIGPALHELQMRSFLTDPYYANVIVAAVEGILNQRESAMKEANAFKEFVGRDRQEAEISAFQKANPHLKTRNEVILAMELADLKAGKAKEIKAAERKSAAQTVKDLKAKGQLRRLTGGTRTNLGTSKSYPKDENSIRTAWASDLARRLGSG